MQDNSSMLSFGDLMSILLVCFTLIATLILAHVSKEYSTKVELLERKQTEKTAQGGELGEQAAFVTIGRDGGIVLEGQAYEGRRHIVSPQALYAKMEAMPPSCLYIRADAQVPYGVVLGILMDLQGKGIMAALAAKEG